MTHPGEPEVPADRPGRPPRNLAVGDVRLEVTAHDGGSCSIVAHHGPLSYTLDLDPMQAHLLAIAVRPERFRVGDRAWWNGEWVEVRNGPYVGWSVETFAGRQSTASDAQLVTRGRRERIVAAAAERAAADRAAAAAVEEVAAAD
jgi:hypothetical protein